MKISGVLIAKNEERCIRRCIESYDGIADEFIVVDTGSTDATRQIAEECGARVVHFAWNNNFADARNYAISQCKGDWIIMLDADEWFSPGSAKRFREEMFKYHGNHGVKGYLMLMTDKMPGDDETEERARMSYRTVRAFRNTPAIRYHNRIHERVKFADKDIKCISLTREVVELYHDGYREEAKREKAERNLRAVMEVYEESNDPEYLHYIATDYYRLDEHEKGLEYFRKMYAQDVFLPFFGLYPHYLALKAMYNAQYPMSEISALIDDICQRYPEQPSAVYLKADYLYSVNRLTESLSYYEKTVELLGDSPENKTDFGITIGMDGYVDMLIRMAEIEELRGNDIDAANHLLKAIQTGVSKDKAFAKMARLLRSLSAEKTIEHWRHIVDLNDIKNIELLMRTYRKVKPGLEYLHFFEKWFLQTGKQDIHFITMLIVIGEYRDAFKRLLALQKESQSIYSLDSAFTVAILAGHPEWLEEDAGRWPEHYSAASRNISRGEKLRDEEWGLYLSLLNKLVLYTQPNDPRLAQFLATALWASDENILLYIDILHHSDNTALMQPLLEKIARSDSEQVRAQGLRTRVMMAYKQGDYAQASNILAQASAGNAPYQMFEEYRVWIDQKLAQ